MVWNWFQFCGCGAFSQALVKVRVPDSRTEAGANVDSKGLYLYNVDCEKHTGVGVLGATRQRMGFLAGIEGNTLEFMRREAVGSI